MDMQESLNAIQQAGEQKRMEVAAKEAHETEYLNELQQKVRTLVPDIQQLLQVGQELAAHIRLKPFRRTISIPPMTNTSKSTATNLSRALSASLQKVSIIRRGSITAKGSMASAGAAAASAVPAMSALIRVGRLHSSPKKTTQN